MKKGMKTGRLLVRVGLGIVVAAAVAGGTMTLVKAFNPQPDPPGDIYSLVGLVEGQTLELTASNHALAATQPGAPVPPGPCAVTFMLFDRAGHVVMTKSDILLQAGQSHVVSFQAPDTDDGGHAGVVRNYLRPAIYFRAAAASDVFGTGGDSCVSGANIVEATGQSSVSMNPGVTHGTLTGNHNETLVIDTDR
jgi:hypothetical protein